ncbi:hypothetical protein ACIBO9_48580 [Streptomyces prunicolor]|uniref:hypothetical protein n=1 Tax=Streptomyces prunicolor TaxID=67348 RepID=UPI0037D18CBF
MRPGRGTPPMTVAVTSSGEMAAAPVAAALRAQPRLRVLGQEQAARAEAMLIMAHELGEQTLKVMHDADVRREEAGRAEVVLGVERFGTERQLLRAVDHGLVCVRPRSRAGIDRIVLALLRTRDGRTDLDPPESMARALRADLGALRHQSSSGLSGLALDADEAEMLRLLAGGLSSEDIALALNRPERKVQHVIHRSCTRLSLGHRTWAARAA